MMRGKSICKVLKTIRKQVADANDIKYEPRECHHQGDCRGTCPACEAEVKYIEQQLDIRRQLGKAVAIVGISAGLSALTSCNARNSSAVSEDQNSIDRGKATIDTTEQIVGDVYYESPVDTVIIEKDPAKIKHRTAKFAAQEKRDSIEMPEPPALGWVDSAPEDILDMPIFPGGPIKLMEFIKNNLHYPNEKDSCAQGRVILTFVVDTDGSIDDVKVVRSVDPLLDNEAIRVVKMMPQWNPGKAYDGTPVRVKYTLPITFMLE